MGNGGTLMRGHPTMGGDTNRGGSATPTVLNPPGFPFAWFDASNIDGHNNSTLVNGQTLPSWKNLGTAGTAYDAVQAIPALQPFYRTNVANGLPAVENSVAIDRWMGSTLPAGTIAQPIQWFAMVKAKSSQAGGGILWDCAPGAGNRIQMNFVSLQARLFAGAFALSTSFLVVNQWESFSALYNGATSFSRLNGVQSANVNPGAALQQGVTLLAANLAGGSPFDGFLAELIGYTSVLPFAPTVEAYLAAKYGVTPHA